MKWLFSLFKPKTSPEDEARIERYREYRKAGLKLSAKLAKLVPKPAVPECGKKLGITKAGTLIINNDDEVAVLYDYCLHYYRRSGKNTIERFLEQMSPVPGTPDAELLKAMQKSRYSLFKIQDILAHQGAVLRDLVTGDTLNIIDITLSQTGVAGVIVAGRIWPLADFNMSAGVLIPVPDFIYADKMQPVIDKFIKPEHAGGKLSAAQEASFVAEIIRVALREGGEDNAFYTDIDH